MSPGHWPQPVRSRPRVWLRCIREFRWLDCPFVQLKGSHPLKANSLLCENGRQEWIFPIPIPQETELRSHLFVHSWHGVPVFPDG